MLVYGDFDDTISMLILEFSLGITGAGIAGFYLFQTRELRRFFLQRTSEKKQDQLMNVLNSQSDAIIVVQKSKTPGYEGSDFQTFAPNEDVPLFVDTRVEFCNSKSIKIFETDLTKLEVRR